MILPGKHIEADRSLIVLGSEVLAALDEPRTVNDVWARIRAVRDTKAGAAPLTFDWFVLTLTFLNAISAVTLDGKVLRREPSR